MIKRVIKYITALTGLSGLIIAIGAVGASDCDAISFKDLAIRLAIALILGGVAYVGLCLQEVENE